MPEKREAGETGDEIMGQLKMTDQMKEALTRSCKLQPSIIVDRVEAEETMKKTKMMAFDSIVISLDLEHEKALLSLRHKNMPVAELELEHVYDYSDITIELTDGFMGIELDDG